MIERCVSVYILHIDTILNWIRYWRADGCNLSGCPVTVDCAG